MLGGLVTLSALALVFALIIRSANSVRYLAFVTLTGASSLMRTGLVETLFPGIPPMLLDLLKVCAGPLSAVLVIRYMAIWLGAQQVDPTVHRVALWGAGAMLLAALLLGVLVFLVPEREFYRLLRASAIVTAVATVIGVAAALRAALMGDPLARWAALAGGCLTVALFGLYARSVHLPGFGLGTWMLTALCIMAYFLIGSAVVVLRIRQTRQLDRLAALQSGADPATGLPTGSILLAEVEHAFWRTARLHGECTVVCLHLGNLYALGEAAGRGAEHQILVAMAARIRRAAGFRCIVGLYHPRCFMVVISTDRHRKSVVPTIARLHALTAQPLTVVGRDGTHHEFLPRLGLGVVTLNPSQARPMDVLNDAERRALGPGGVQAEPEDDTATRPCDRFMDTAGAAL